MSSSVTWEDENPCEALGVVREELPILYTNSFIRRRAELPRANILYIGVDVAETGHGAAPLARIARLSSSGMVSSIVISLLADDDDDDYYVR